jgi:hypothetical protein
MTLTKRSLSLLSLTCLLALSACGDDDGDTSPAHEDGGSHTPTAGHGGSASDAGPSSAPDASGPSGIEIAGEWTDNFGGEETITDTTWDTGFSVATIVSYDNHDNSAITMDPPSEDDAGVEAAGLFGKNVWTEIEGDAFYYCTVSFLQLSAAAAEANAMPADDTNPDVDGCGDSGFAWTKMERK